ncbi:hypothetical protein MNKW57_30770 [Biformimicrobium ophioploci]|uniref:Uncharacterized protein n=2 Tax=Biformimicrobium ophioploci TaxID=3036711 RepID=A0ABQ6M354_9GAMM|nr:hypothetical protein MNKW57_30770 [Microbulbifer sp. NKW57]
MPISCAEAASIEVGNGSTLVHEMQYEGMPGFLYQGMFHGLDAEVTHICGEEALELEMVQVDFHSGPAARNKYIELVNILEQKLGCCIVETKVEDKSYVWMLKDSWVALGVGQSEQGAHFVRVLQYKL